MDLETEHSTYKLNGRKGTKELEGKEKVRREEKRGEGRGERERQEKHIVEETVFKIHTTQSDTCLNVLKSCDRAASPCMLSWTTVLANDLELPGLPTTNKGILSSMQITIMKTFSLSAVLRAMFAPSSSSSRTARWHLGED